MTDPPSALQGLLLSYAERVETALERWLPEAAIQPPRLHEAMRYAALGGGKRIRPALVYATGSALRAPVQTLDAPACAVELLHAYSLVHDDLPAMDDDDLRRGRPTCHRRFDEGTAILVGDALQALAFYTLAHDGSLDISPRRRLQMVETLALAAGSRGMVGGQAMDLDAVGTSLQLAELENMHIHKTGALIRASVRMAALASGAEEPLLGHLDRYAKCVGLAFQVRDDILDVEGETAILGKTSGVDRARQKPTYTSLMGLARAKELALDLHGQAIASLESLGTDADPLRWLSEFMVTRIR